MPTPKRAQEAPESVVSESVTYQNSAGLKITAYIDRPALPLTKEPKWVILAPKYGETKKNNLQLAYLLAANGLNILRFDLTFHVGESEGEMTQFTLANAVDDLKCSIDFLQRHSDVKKVTVLASSLSARCGFRAAAQDSRISHLVCLVGVVNVQHTLREVYQEDLVANHITGKRWGVTDILGHDIDFDRFLRSAVETDMHDFSGTYRDLSRTDCPVTLFPAEKDAWVSREEISKLGDKFPNVRVVPIAGAMHEVRENSSAASDTFRQIVIVCLGNNALPLHEVIEPSKAIVMRQNKIEREKLRESAPAKKPERDFWSNYLEKYILLDRVGDYQEYLTHVASLLGKVEPGETVLDAGCGNGLFGLWLLRDVVKRRLVETGAIVYVGVDLTSKGLSEALKKHYENERPAGYTSPNYCYTMADFDLLGEEYGASLPFADATFDKVCCSLVISYLKQPSHLLSELARVLKPGGTLVLSSMKPYCDMSAIYRDFVNEGVASNEMESARDLLRAAGAIKLKEEQGYYRFYSSEELTEVMSSTGLQTLASTASFGNQAVIIKAAK